MGICGGGLRLAPAEIDQSEQRLTLKLPPLDFDPLFYTTTEYSSMGIE